MRLAAAARAGRLAVRLCDGRHSCVLRLRFRLEFGFLGALAAVSAPRGTVAERTVVFTF